MVRKGINMPPGTGFGSRGISEDCITYGDTLDITFKEAGFFGAGPSGVFTPDLPIGFFSAGQTIGPFKAPNTDKDLILCFFDFGAHFGLYIEDLQVRAICKKSKVRKTK